MTLQLESPFANPGKRKAIHRNVELPSHRPGAPPQSVQRLYTFPLPFQMSPVAYPMPIAPTSLPHSQIAPVFPVGHIAPQEPEPDAQTVLYMASWSFFGVKVRVPPRTGEVEWRAVYVDNVLPSTTASEVMQKVTAGMVESILHVPERNRFVVNFLDRAAASRFYAECLMVPLTLDGKPATVGWARSPPVSATVSRAVAENNASRNVYLEFSGDGPETDDKDALAEREQLLRRTLNFAGTIESIRCLPGRNIWFVHFTNIESAIVAVSHLRENWTDVNVAFGRDPCHTMHKLKKQAALLYLGRSPYDTTQLTEFQASEIADALACQSIAAVLTANISGGERNVGNRCIAIAQLRTGIRVADICNAVRGGMLESVEYSPETNSCYVTFLEPTAAAHFYAMYQLQPLLVRGQSALVSWGHHPGPLRAEIETAASQGSTRNVCIKDIRQPRRRRGEIAPLATESQLRNIFSRYGEIEQIKLVPDLGCYFVSFTNIASAIRAVEWARTARPLPGAQCQHGKDRCAALPRFSKSLPAEPILIQYLRRELLVLSQPASPLYTPAPRSLISYGRSV